MISAIIVIVFGLFIWKLVPGWITQGKKKVRDKIKLICNVTGVVMVLLGCYSLIMTFIRR